eukprot:scaffold2541_cov122-Isochrysis_galbana.AAC.5
MSICSTVWKGGKSSCSKALTAAGVTAQMCLTSRVGRIGADARQNGLERLDAHCDVGRHRPLGHHRHPHDCPHHVRVLLGAPQLQQPEELRQQRLEQRAQRPRAEPAFPQHAGRGAGRRELADGQHALDGRGGVGVHHQVRRVEQRDQHRQHGVVDATRQLGAEDGDELDRLRRHVLGVEVEKVDQRVGLCGAQLGGAALESERDDQVECHVLGLPVAARVGRVLVEQGPDVGREELRHLSLVVAAQAPHLRDRRRVKRGGVKAAADGTKMEDGKWELRGAARMSAGASGPGEDVEQRDAAHQFNGDASACVCV